MKRFLLSVLMVVLAVSAADAQNKRKKDTVNLCNPGHYLVFDVGGGLHTLAYNVDGYGVKKPGAGLMVRGGYRFFFNDNWGLGTELNFKSFFSTFTANYIQSIDNAIDSDVDHFSYQHRTYYHNLKERQTQYVVSLPVGVYFQQRIDHRWKVGGGLGVIGQLEIANKYKTRGGELETRGYYEVYNVELYGMEDYNFFTKSNFSGDSKKRSSIGAFVEGNALYYFTPRLSLDLGIYFTLGFGYKTDDGAYQFDPDCMSANAYKSTYNGALDSRVVDRAMPIAIGGMAGIRYQLNKVKKKKPVPDEPVDIPVEVPDTNVVVDVPEKDTVPEVVVADVPEQPVVVEETPKDTIPEVVDIPKQDTVPAVVVTEPEKKKEDVVLDLKKYTRVNVNFGFNDSYIKSRPDLARMLDEIADVMKTFPQTKLSVTGHTCNIGSLETNMALGQKRAEAFKAELVKRGVAAERISCDSKAYLEPLFPNTTEANREKNRRVEFTMTE